MGFYAYKKFLGKQSINKRSNKIGKYIDIANVFIFKLQICLFRFFFQNNFCFLVGDPDVSTVAPDLIKIQARHNNAGYTDDENHETPHSFDDHDDHIDIDDNFQNLPGQLPHSPFSNPRHTWR